MMGLVYKPLLNYMPRIILCYTEVNGIYITKFKKLGHTASRIFLASYSLYIAIFAYNNQNFPLTLNKLTNYTVHGMSVSKKVCQQSRILERIAQLNWPIMPRGASTRDVCIDINHGLSNISTTLSLNRKCSVYRIPAHVRELDKAYYEPSMVSIGPYHRKEKHLQAMEEHKWRYLRDFLSRGLVNETADHRMRRYTDMIRRLEPEVRECYFESTDLDSTEFVAMLLLDASFIIEFFVKWFSGEDDPLFSVSWSLPLLLNDMLMLENQIPFFVIERLYDISTFDPDRPEDAQPKPSLIGIITDYLRGIEDAEVRHDRENVHHMLHLYHCCFVQPLELPRNANEEGGNANNIGNPFLFLPKMIPCATQLREFGVHIKKNKHARSMFDISFRNGTLEIPRVAIEEMTRSRYMNLIAFEQCHDNGKYLTSYAVFMAYLINTAQDAILLQRYDVIDNKLANEEEAAKFFSQLHACSYINYDEHYLAPVFRDINTYCRRWWPKRRARLCHDYFASPWAVISFLAALIFMGFSIFKIVVMILSVFFHFHERK